MHRYCTQLKLKIGNLIDITREDNFFRNAYIKFSKKFSRILQQKIVNIFLTPLLQTRILCDLSIYLGIYLSLYNSFRLDAKVRLAKYKKSNEPGKEISSCLTLKLKSIFNLFSVNIGGKKSISILLQNILKIDHYVLQIVEGSDNSLTNSS